MVEMNKDPNEFIWVEAYRPQSVDDCVLPKHTKKQIQDFVQSGDIPHFLFAGSPGTGKTTLARAIARELDMEVLFINASSENNIETIRTKVKQFASTVSLQDQSKLVILDESDGLTPAGQNALRGYLEEFSNNCRFIFTCNFQNKLIEALHSRLQYVSFTIPHEERSSIANEIYKRCMAILDNEGISYDKKVLQQLVKRYFPDFRRLISELQGYSAGGQIDTGILANSVDSTVAELFEYLKEKDWTKMRDWVAEHSDVDFASLTRAIYNQAKDHFKSNCLPDLVLILADAQYKRAFVADPEIHTVATMTEIMSAVEAK